MPVFDQTKLGRAFALLEEGAAQGAFAGAVAAVGGRAGVVASTCVGHAALTPERVPMTPETLFDLASLTKVVATTPAVLRLLEEGAFVLDTPVQHLIPQFPGTGVTLRHLLTHTSGLPAWRPLYLDNRGWQAYTKAICATEPVRSPGTDVEYSDLGFMLLGAIVQGVTGLTLPEFCTEAIFTPLQMTSTGWLPAVPRHRIAATETGNQIEYGMCKERAAGFARWRRDTLWGEVNDGNAWYGLDGISSHAGLFGTAPDLARFAAAWLNGGQPVIGPQTAALATRSYTAGMADNRGLGWQKPPAASFPATRASCGDMFSPAAFGHTGFTGTSLWIDPAKDLFVLLLTNRLHPVPCDRFYAVRPAFHNAVAASLVDHSGGAWA